MHARRALALVALCPLLAGVPAFASADMSGMDVFREEERTWPGGAPKTVVKPDPVHRRYKHAVLVMPRLSSRFGYRFHPIRHEIALHSGIDIPGAEGTPVQASAGGTVRFAGRSGGYGNMVEIDHGRGLATRYAHLSSILVRPGAAVTQGETIALMGSTGLATGPHLHFEVRSHGRAADPLAYLASAPPVPASALAVAAAPRFDYRAARYESSKPHISQFARTRDAAGSTSGDRSRATIGSLP